MQSDEFHGVKAALFNGRRLLVYLRDDKPTIPFPGCWDLPGGGRENDEDPVACAQREVHEEFGIWLTADRFLTQRRYEGLAGSACSYFLTATLSDEDIAAISFGDEGQTWALMEIDSFLGHENAVPALQTRLAENLSDRDQVTS